MSPMFLMPLAFLLPVFLLGGPDSDQPAKKDEPPVNDKRFHQLFLKTAETYTEFGRVDDEFRWAPFLCRMPSPGVARFSESKDNKTHGRKLYSLLAKDRSAYLKVKKAKTSPVGQIIVKESWLPVETTASVEIETRWERKKTADGENAHGFRPVAVRGGKIYKTGKQGPLFIMAKVEQDTEGTDQGWIYGTVDLATKKVTSSGTVRSCMKCHVKAPHDRLFGLEEVAWHGKDPATVAAEQRAAIEREKKSGKE